MMSPLGMAPSPVHHIKRLTQKRETITALVDALEAFLAFDLDADLESFGKDERGTAAPSRHARDAGDCSG